MRITIHVTSMLLTIQSRLGSYPYPYKDDSDKNVKWGFPVYKTDIYHENSKGKDVRVTNTKAFSIHNSSGFFSATRFGMGYNPFQKDKRYARMDKPRVVGLKDGHLHRLKWDEIRTFNPPEPAWRIMIPEHSMQIEHGNRNSGEGTTNPGKNLSYFVHPDSSGLLGCIGVKDWKNFLLFIKRIGRVQSLNNDVAFKKLDIWIWLDKLNKRPDVKRI